MDCCLGSKVSWEFNTLNDNQTRRQAEKEKHFSLPWGKLLWLWCFICQSLTLFMTRHVWNFMISVFICIYLPVIYLHFYETKMKNVQYYIIYITVVFFYVPGNKLNYLRNKVWKMNEMCCPYWTKSWFETDFNVWDIRWAEPHVYVRQCSTSHFTVSMTLLAQVMCIWSVSFTPVTGTKHQM